MCCISRKGRECEHACGAFLNVCMAPGCCMSPAYVRVRDVGECIAGSSVGKGVTEEERKRVCACMWCIVYLVVSYCRIGVLTTHQLQQPHI